LIKTCIIDSSSAILLYKGGIFGELLDHYKTLCPPAVITELTRNPTYPGAEYFLACCNHKNFLIEYPERSGTQYIEKLPHGLGAGEAECIALYYKKSGDFIILDDKRGAQWCKNQNIPFINALLVPKILFLCGCLSEENYNTIFSLFLKEGRYSEKVSQYASDLQLVDLSPFLPVQD